MPADFTQKITEAREISVSLGAKPSVITYSRLEPLSLTRGDLGPGLQMPIADPLWLLGRQWQFGELHGEDGGTPVVATIAAEHAPAVLDGSGLPVEVAVEAETPAVLPERVRAHTGLQLMRQLTAALPPGERPGLRAVLLRAFSFQDHSGTPQSPFLHGRVPDGSRALAALTPLPPTGLPEALSAVSPAHHSALRAALTAWATWAAGYLTPPAGSYWDSHRQEYSFTLRAGLTAGQVELKAGEYYDGTVDWYTFDATMAGGPTGTPEKFRETVIPSPIRYPGMPSDRLWAFEDGSVYLGGLDAGPTDLARLALVEFSLVYGNDWFLVPFDLPYGSASQITALTVKDTFGVTVNIPASRDVGRPGWTVFQHTGPEDASSLADVFFLPATVRHAQEGPPLEEVAYFRDEMANLVWGVERIIPGPHGEPVDRARQVAKVSLRQQIPGDLGDARIIYRLMSPVPEHWIPFVAVPVEGLPLNAFATELERRPMIRFLDDGTADIVHPHGTIMATRLAFEEVPREGIVVTRSFQSARTHTGTTLLWIGRRKHVGTGEGFSGLRFDTALPPSAW